MMNQYNSELLTNDSPDYLKSNFTVALNSIKIDSLSANYVNWDSMNDKEKNILIDEAIKNNYILSCKSCEFLKNNKKIVLESIKKSKSSLTYAKSDLWYDFDIFKYMILNSRFYNENEIKKRTLNYLLDYDILASCLDTFCISYEYEKVEKRIIDLYYDALKNKPKIENIKKILDPAIEEDWNIYKKKNINIYGNVFSKICSELRNNKDFEKVLENLSFLNQIKKVLGKKYQQLLKSMRDYFDVFHSNKKNKQEKLLPFQDIISNLSALYIAKSKESYKKDKIKEYYNWLIQFFELRVDHPTIHKRIITAYKKQLFLELYKKNDSEITDFIDSICDKYISKIDLYIICDLIRNFLFFNKSKINQILIQPKNYNNFLRYEKSLKLIKRLNIGYINYDSSEVKNYQDIIAYDNIKNEYVYIGVSFDDFDYKNCQSYKEKTEIFEKIKREIIEKVQELEIDKKISFKVDINFASKFPFTDEYFRFDESYYNLFKFNDLICACMPYECVFNIDVFINDEIYKNLYNFLVNNNILWYLLFLWYEDNYNLNNKGISIDDVIGMFQNMNKITSIAKILNFDITKFNELLFVNNLILYSDERKMVVLGTEVIKKTYENNKFSAYPESKNIKIAEELVCKMAKRNTSTIPYINGKTINYKYSLYDNLDEKILLSGIDTQSCFQIGGYDNDFLHYCALDKNGFVIKITDLKDNLIAKASGFRNGNCVFINQLRTIYDEGGNSYLGELENEKKEIIKTFKVACKDMINISHNNIDEKIKIDYVFVTKSYILKDYGINCSDKITKEIRDNLVNIETQDWLDFVENTNNLEITYKNMIFANDFSSYPIICIAKINNKKITLDNIKLKDVDDIYERPRSKVVATNPNEKIIKKINKIRGIKAFFENKSFKEQPISITSIVFIGDNWYIILDNNSIIETCLLDFDKKAKLEFELTINIIKQYSNKRLAENIELNNFGYQVKLLNRQL